MERKTTESTPMPNVEEQQTRTIEFSRLGNGNEITGNTTGTIKDNSRTKRTSFMDRFAAMAGMKPRDKGEVTAPTDKSKTFGKVSAITKEAGQEKEQVTEGTAGHPESHLAESKTPLVELGNLMLKLEQMDKKLKGNEEDRQDMRKELRHKKKEKKTNTSP